MSFKAFMERLRERHAASSQRNIKRIVNETVTIHNDPNDPDNKCYIYVSGVPIWSVEGVSASSEIVKVIKTYYENQLNNRPCDGRKREDKGI